MENMRIVGNNNVRSYTAKMIYHLIAAQYPSGYH